MKKGPPGNVEAFLKLTFYTTFVLKVDKNCDNLEHSDKLSDLYPNDLKFDCNQITVSLSSVIKGGKKTTLDLCACVQTNVCTYACMLTVWQARVSFGPKMRSVTLVRERHPRGYETSNTLSALEY